MQELQAGIDKVVLWLVQAVSEVRLCGELCTVVCRMQVTHRFLLAHEGREEEEESRRENERGESGEERGERREKREERERREKREREDQEESGQKNKQEIKVIK